MTLKKETIVKNGIKLMTTFACPIENGQKSNKRFKKKEDFYDKSGNVIEHLEYKRGKIDKWEKFQFNTQGQLIEKIKFNCIGWDKTKFKSTSEKFTYYQDGRLITPNKTVVEKDMSGNIAETSFFLNGKIKGRKIFSSSGICKEELEYKSEQVVRRVDFDEKGNVLRISNFDTTGQPLNHSLFEYDERGNQTTIKKVSRKGEIKQSRLLTYDTNDNLIDDTDILEEILEATDDRNFTLTEEDKSGSYKHLYSYNDSQLLKEHKMILAGEMIMIYEYDYKFYGN